MHKLTAYLIGFLAGALVPLTIAVSIYVCVTLFSLLFLALGELSRDAATVTGSSSALDAIGPTILNSVKSGLQGLWRDRLGFLIFSVVGAVAAWGHQIGLVAYRDRAWLVSFLCTALITVIPAITWLVAERAEVALWIAEQPDTFVWRNQLSDSYILEVGLGLLFGLPLTYAAWVIWRWWYLRLGRWFSPASLPSSSAGEQNLSREPEWATGSARSEQLDGGAAQVVPLQRIVESQGLVAWLAILLAFSLALLLVANRYHSQVAVNIEHGSVRLDAISRPEHTVQIQVEPNARALTVVKRAGDGTVNLYLNPVANSEESVGSVEDWSFGRRDPNLYTSIPLANVEPGDYHIRFVQESGVGYFEYTLSHGGGAMSQASALAVGFLVACSLVLGVVLIFLIAARYFYYV
jgi:hypothetical protein